jgi:predicted O-linked N-acetylglucosamine transferase (SPINDLY family)
MTAFSGDREINLSEVIHTSESFYVEKAVPRAKSKECRSRARAQIHALRMPT